MTDVAPPHSKRPRRSRALATRVEDAKAVERKAAEQLARAEARRQAAAERLARKVRQREKYETAAAVRERKLDTRRKIIAGALALEHRRHDPTFGASLQNLLDEYVTRPEERELFGLAPLPATAEPSVKVA